MRCRFDRRFRCYEGAECVGCGVLVRVGQVRFVSWSHVTKINVDGGEKSMVDVGEFKKGRGDWLTADDVSEGDKLTILDEGFMDDETFDKEYFVVSMRLDRNGMEKQVRLGSRNVERIAEKFGDQTSGWVNREVEVAAIEKYKSLGQKGIIFRPVVKSNSTAKSEKPVLVSGETEQQLLAKIRQLSLEEQKGFLEYIKTAKETKE